jgi:glycosyltransferase involved in cell wall biosynthesis
LHPAGPRIVFVRHGQDGQRLLEVPAESLARRYEHLANGELPASRPPAEAPGSPYSAVMRLRIRIIHRIERLPDWMREPLLLAGVLQVRALRCAAMCMRPAPPAEPAPVEPAGDTAAPTAGDIFLILTAPLQTGAFSEMVRRLRDDHAVAAAVLIHDLSPLRHPEWFSRQEVEQTAWLLQQILPQCSCLMAAGGAIRQARGADADTSIAARMMPIPLGAALQTPPPIRPRPRDMPPAGSYVLYAASLDAGKNHALLLRLWRRLLDDLPPGRVPDLIFAGHVGSLVGDLLQQLENASWLEGKIRLLHEPSDTDLTCLYDGCRFTLFPSLGEGNGLAVSESLAMGRPCVCSDRIVLPEAQRHLVCSFDPENAEAAYQIIRNLIDDPAALEGWRERVARESRPATWDHAADAILTACLAMPQAASASSAFTHPA